MKIGPKYKIARRLGAPIFEKTQTQKYALRAERKGVKRGSPRAKSEYGVQHNEKQKARFTYGITEKQFANYIKESILKKSRNPAQTIFQFLESRLDNVLYRIGLASTRLGARQMASHGHILLNGRRGTIPSRRLYLGDKISVRKGSETKALFSNFDERFKNVTVPDWIRFDAFKREAEIIGLPQLTASDSLFNLNAVVEFYSR